MDHRIDEIPISDFINKELILFSMADNIRSIPSVMDGFKPGQRKILFACFKRNLKAEIKVCHLRLICRSPSWLVMSPNMQLTITVSKVCVPLSLTWPKTMLALTT